ncbi:MAG: ATP synthase F0 subunit B [Acidobacteria bacterium]|nr:ATP synthase F0 subunit B [Acidobacteriota bacterium]
MKRRQLLALAALMVLLLCICAPLRAAEEGGGKEDLVGSPIGWTVKWINFAILVGGMWYLLKDSAPQFFRNRATAIGASIADAATVKEEAERRLREAEEKIGRLDQERAELSAVAKHEAAGESVRIRNAAREEGEKIQRAAKMELEAAERAARMELKALAAKLAADRAEEMLYQQVTADVETRLVKGFVDGLERRAN